MKRLLIATLLAVGTLGIAATASAHSHALPAGYKLPASYQAVYCYPGGTYWQSQLANPNNAAYYAAHNAQFTALYGTGTIYCTP